MMTNATTHATVLPMFSPAAEAPTKRYRTIVADPPWRYDSKLVGLRGATDYPTMTQDELLNMPIGLWAGKDSHLYLWTTDAFIVQAHQLAVAWGFEVKNVIVWAKGRDEQQVSMGVGFYFRHACEFILFGIRGSQAVKDHGQPNIFFAPRGAHSEKPAAFYDMVQLCPPGCQCGRHRCKTLGKACPCGRHVVPLERRQRISLNNARRNGTSEAIRIAISLGKYRTTNEEWFVANTDRRSGRTKRRLLLLGLAERCAICGTPPNGRDEG